MKKIGFVDYYISEWHANNYPKFIQKICERTGDEFCVSYAWAEMYESPADGRNTDEWCEKYGVEKCDTIDELCQKSDYIIILAPDDSDKHLEYAEAVFKYKKPTFIDKTFAPDYATAKKIFDIADKYGTKFFSTSALRYADELEGLDADGGVVSMGGGTGLGIYAVHLVEMIVKLIPSRPVSLRTSVQGEQIVSCISFEGGKKATMLYVPHMGFSVCAKNTNGGYEHRAVVSNFFGTLMEEVLKFFSTGVQPFDPEQTLNVMKIIEAVTKSLETPDEKIEI